MRTASAAEIVRRGAKTVHIELTGECYDGTSQNVCATIPGTDKAEEVITLGGHYDSVYFSSGVHDNLSGSVIVLERCGISPPSAAPDAALLLVRLGRTGAARLEGVCQGARG